MQILTRKCRSGKRLASNDMTAVSVCKFVIRFGSGRQLRVAFRRGTDGRRCLRDGRDNLVLNLHLSRHSILWFLTGELEASGLKMPILIASSISYGVVQRSPGPGSKQQNFGATCWNFLQSNYESVDSGVKSFAALMQIKTSNPSTH